MNSPIAMISYSSKDCVAADLIQDELALRGFNVIRDQISFTDGSRNANNMKTGVETCDVFVAYLTRHSLYLDEPDDHPRPALESELRPALQRRRRNLNNLGVSKPIIIPVAHGLGDRDEAGEIIRRQTGEQIDSLWRSEWLNQNTAHITQPEAARLADQALRTFLDQEPPKPPIKIFIATRSTSPPPYRFTINGTRLLGGNRRPGDRDSWSRLYAGLCSLAQRLQSHCAGDVSVELACHLSAAFAVGRTLHQASRWSPRFSTNGDIVTPSTENERSNLQGDLDRYARPGDLLVDLNLLEHDVATPSDRLAVSLNLGGRISLARNSAHHMSPIEIAVEARSTAIKIRSAHASIMPNKIHLTMAAPAGFAALLGYHLTSLEADIVTYEFANYEYHEALVIPSVSP